MDNEHILTAMEHPNVPDRRIEFNNLLYSTGREVESLIAFLEKTDFYDAPASSRFHSNFRYGLVHHSLCVYEAACGIYKGMVDVVNSSSIPDAYSKCDCLDDYKKDLIIPCLLHDVCKIGNYGIESKNAKGPTGWFSYYDYKVMPDVLPMGHGEKSVYIIQRMVELDVEESLAIRWHRGMFEAGAQTPEGQNWLVSSLKRNLLIGTVNAADQLATFSLEFVVDRKQTHIDKISKS